MIYSMHQSEQEQEKKNFRLAGEKDEMTAESNSLDVQVSSDAEESLEGVLYLRKGRSSGHTSWSWKRRYIVFRFENGGSILSYKDIDQAVLVSAAQQPASVMKSVYSNFHGRHPHRDFYQFSENLEIEITADLPWLAKDVENDPSTFVIEITTRNEEMDDDHGVSVRLVDYMRTISSEGQRSELDDEAFASDDDMDDDDGTRTIDFQNADGSIDGRATVSTKQDDLMDELNVARKKGKPLRIYFRCDGGLNEKSLWLRAFSRFGRLSDDVRKKKTLFSSFASSVLLGSSWPRSIPTENANDRRNVTFAPEAIIPSTMARTTEIQPRVGRVAVKDKEFRILPMYAYPHCWLTKSEMREEMLLPSDHFHDLRVPGCKGKEIGALEVEVLQCIGLPKMDRGSDTDAVVYLVCGSYAFSTDVIFNRVNPMWLRKTRRACVFPLFHGYARLYVGVFDHERKVKDDFAGRVVIDLARLRPHSTYDVTLPLRLSTHVYSRRRRGAVRLRFTLKWTSERDALLSYIPKSLKITLPQHSKPNFETTVMCTDQKAFRNIAITVHGAHLPRRFTFNQMRAAIREINFTRKYIFTVLRKTVREIMQWKNPAISGFVFLSWMHCVFANAFSLVPFYLVVYFLLFLMRNYAKYGMDASSQRGFVPPSWEELFFSLVRGGDPNCRHIEPLELGMRHPSLTRRKSPESAARSGVDYTFSQYSVVTHKPRGKKLLQALGFVPDPNKNPNEDHIEFPFADGKDYAKFSVKECLVIHGKQSALTVVGATDLLECASTIESGVSDGELPRNGAISRFPLDMDLQRLMRKDSSGTKDYDEEENNFNASRAVMSQGKYLNEDSPGKEFESSVLTVFTSSLFCRSQSCF
jgi:C2 domain